MIKKLLFIFFVVLLVCGCRDDKSEDDYKVIGEMIVARNKARQQNSPSTLKQEQAEQTGTKDSKKNKPTMMFEEEVKIVSTSTGKVIARATAYLDKSGRVINIRIKKR